MDDDNGSTRSGTGHFDSNRRSARSDESDGAGAGWGGRTKSAYGRPRLPRKPHASDPGTGLSGAGNRFGNMRDASRPPFRGERPKLDTRFEPTMDAAQQRLDRVRPNAYAKTRNFIDGAVTLLSPYLTHGFLHVPGCIETLSLKHPLTLEDKLVYEFAWREYFHHVWSRLGDGILSDIRNPVWRGRYESNMPEDILQGATGVAVIDAAVRTLYAEGYLHNHMRMWLASYIVHIRKVDWKAGAAWMYTHLLDGDLASNSLSWQWVAGTFAHKPYLFNADNVSRYFAGMDCKGTAIDTSYVDLEAIARGRNSMGPEPGLHERVEPPEPFDGNLVSLLQKHGFRVLDDAAMNRYLDETDVELRHPWHLGATTAQPARTVAWLDADFHQRFAWSARRWDFVLRRLREISSDVWLTHSTAFAKTAPRTHAINTLDTLNPGYCALKDHGNTHVKPAPRFFSNPLQLQPSFTRFFDQAMAGRELNLSVPTTSRYSA